MTTSPVPRWSSRASAAVAAGSLAMVALAAVPPTAQAESPQIDYRCKALGLADFVMPVVLDTSLPQRLTTSQTTQVVLKSTADLPGSTAKQIADKGGRTLEASFGQQVTLGATAATAAISVPRTAIPDQTTPPPVRLADSSDAFAWTAPATPGPVDVVAGTITGELRWFTDGDVKTSAALTCTVPNGQPPVIDTVSVAASTTTTLELARTTAAYGQDVSASATVTGAGGVPTGEVSFTVGNSVTRARVDKAGVASLVLPDRAIGTYTVTATFVPGDPLLYVASTSVSKLLTVSKAETGLKVAVTGKRTGSATRVAARAAGAYGTAATGKVKFTLKRLGTAGRWARVRTLSGGSARVGFGSLKVGRYKVVVRYAGDASHLSAKTAKRFRVKPG